MKLTPEEKAARRAAFHAMSGAKKREHIWEYYKWPILLGLLALLILGSILRGALTKKEPVLYLALANVSVGEDLETELTAGFLEHAGFDARRQEVFLYSDLYLTDNADTLNHQYAYASKTKLMGTLASRKLDLALMNREAYDFLSQHGYLLDLLELSGLLDGQAAALLTDNEVVLSDNSLEVLLGEAEEEQRVTERVFNALDVAALPLFQNAGFDGDLYLGVIGNSPRLETAAAYLRFVSACP